MNKAIFLDRDGTIIKDKGYINKINNVSFYNYTFESLRKLQKHYKLFLVTNQQGVSKGIISLSELESIHNYILETLLKEDISIKKIYFCPHNADDNCVCRKPNTLFAELAKKEFSIDLSSSFVIGDHLSDSQFAINSGAKAIYLLTGHGRKHRNRIPVEMLPNIIIKQNLKFAADFILKNYHNKA